MKISTFIRLVFSYSIICGIYGCKDASKGKDTVQVDSLDCEPLLLNGKKRVALEVGKMTPSKGLKIFRITVTYTNEDMDAMSRRLYKMDSLALYLQDSVEHLLRPFHPLCDEYDSIQGIVALSPDDMGNNTIIASVEGDGKLRLNYKGENVFLSPVSMVVDRYEKMSDIDHTFMNDSIEIQVKGYFADSVNQGYSPGLGYFYCKKDDQLMTEKKVYLLFRRDYLMGQRR